MLVHLGLLTKQSGFKIAEGSFKGNNSSQRCYNMIDKTSYFKTFISKLDIGQLHVKHDIKKCLACDPDTQCKQV